MPVGKRQFFPFRMADGRQGEALRGRLEFPVYHLSDARLLRIDVNGDIVPAAAWSTSAVDPGTKLTGIRFSLSLARCPALRGDNELGLTLLSTGDSDDAPYMEELDILVQ